MCNYKWIETNTYVYVSSLKRLHWGLGIRYLRDLLNVQILSVQYGYLDSLFIGTIDTETQCNG